eukprot:87398-Heterocapsa_arctica.AAC.1
MRIMVLDTMFRSSVPPTPESTKRFSVLVRLDLSRNRDPKADFDISNPAVLASMSARLNMAL